MNKTVKFYFKYPAQLFINIRYRISSIFIRSHYDLIVIDDIFPNKLSAWRFEEFTHYINEFGLDKTCIFTTGHSLGALHGDRSRNGVKELIKDFRLQNPKFKKSVKRYVYHRSVSAKLGYVLFLSNADNFLKYFETNKIPFVFTLYPGAGFLINSEDTLLVLRKVMASSFFRGVIVTQKITNEYLLKHNLCNPGKIHFIFGVVAPKYYVDADISRKKYFINNTMNIAFVANKQMPKGIDKGYDVFIDTAKLLAEQNDKIRFHIVGPFDETDIDVRELGDRIVFYNYLESQKLIEFYKKIDLLVSPNIPFILKPGAFDGFPTAAASEAALNGVAIAVTDPLNQNIHFEDKKDLIFITSNPLLISKEIMYYYNNPSELIAIAKNGSSNFKTVYSEENQLKKRIDILRNEID